jgi:hypothetical protein
MPLRRNKDSPLLLRRNARTVAIPQQGIAAVQQRVC